MALAAIADAEGEIHRTLTWLETEQLSFWETQIRKRHDWVEKCKDAYRQKTLFKDVAGHRSSGFDERKALEKAQRALEEAGEKIINVKRNIRVLQKELQNYTGAVQRFSTDILVELPNTIAKIEKMESQLEQYVNLAAPETSGNDSSDSVSVSQLAAPSMSRGITAELRADAADQERLRQRTPAASARLVAAAASQLDFLSSTSPLNGAQRMAVAAMNNNRHSPEPNQTLVICTDIIDPANIYLHRDVPAGALDTGWFVGPAGSEAPIEQIARTTVESLLAVRPDLREILALPQGFVVVIGPRGIAGVYNSKGLDMWKA